MGVLVLPKVTAVVDALTRPDTKTTPVVRFNVHFAVVDEDTKTIICEEYLIGFRLMTNFIWPPTYGTTSPQPVIYLDKPHAEALVAAVLRREGELKVLAPEIELAPPEVLVEALQMPLMKFGRLFPTVAKDLGYRRG